MQRWRAISAPRRFRRRLYRLHAGARLEGLGAELQASLDALAGPRSLSYLHRLIALGLFGVGYAMHRKEQRSADFMASGGLNGWMAGIACIAGSILFLIVFDVLIGLEDG